MTSELNKEVLSKAATSARGLAIDAVHACSSGHLGLPLGCAEMGASNQALTSSSDSVTESSRPTGVGSALHGCDPGWQPKKLRQASSI